MKGNSDSTDLNVYNGALNQDLTSIIIITYNKFDYNKLCFESIREYTQSDSYEIIVVDNGSTDGTVEWLQGQTDIKLILNKENAGFPAGCNQGIMIANGSSILLLNNDTIVTPNWLTNLKKCLFSANDIGAVGAITSSCSNFQNIPCEYSSIEEMICFARSINQSYPGFQEDRGRLVGYCMLIKKEVVDKIGLMDEVFSPGNYEDDDYSLRIRKAGYRLVLCRNAFIHHFGSVSFASFGERSVQFNTLLGVNRKKFSEKWGIDPHSVAPSGFIEDPALKKWFVYQHEFNYHRQIMSITRNKFYSIIEQAEFALLSGNYEKAMTKVMKAADYAHHSHPGFFVSARLELILRKIAGKIDNQAVASFAGIPGKDRNKRNILHVLSQGYTAPSGHTKTLERWILTDKNSVHSIAVTLNSTTNPQELSVAALQSGGWYRTLDNANLTLHQRAQLLRNMAYMWADIVILHIHPHDPIAPVAFGVCGGPPVLFLNHADHAFNIGMSVADLVVEHRNAGRTLSQVRRMISASYQLPVPLSAPSERVDTQTAKHNLGIDTDKIVFLTVVQPYQIAICGEYNYIKLVKEISSRYQDAQVLIVGLADAGEWAQLKSESNGRIKAVGSQTDLQPYYSAADIYLDSIPHSSYTEALKAGAAGLPVTGMTAELAEQLSSDIQSDSIQTHFCNYKELFSVIDRLVGDEKYRSSQGSWLQAAILKNHYFDWREHLTRLYTLVPSCHVPSETVTKEEAAYGFSDIIWTYFQQRSGLSYSSFG